MCRCHPVGESLNTPTWPKKHRSERIISLHKTNLRFIESSTHCGFKWNKIIRKNKHIFKNNDKTSQWNVPLTAQWCHSSCWTNKKVFACFILTFILFSIISVFMYIQSVEGLKFKVWTVWAFYFSLCAATKFNISEKKLGRKTSKWFSAAHREIFTNRISCRDWN